MKGNSKLYSVSEIAKILKVNNKTVLYRANILGLIPTTFGNSTAFYYNFGQIEKIKFFKQDKVRAQIIKKEVKTIVHHVTWHIRDSKINFLTLEQL